MRADSDRDPVEVAPYSPDWPRRFAAERDALAAVFPPDAFAIEHIGSTAVPGLGAKPIVDVLIGAPALTDVEARIPAMRTLGYRYVPEHEAVLPERRYFAKPATGPGQFHVHAVQRGGRFWAEHLRFRDALRADSRLAADYFRLKVELTARFGGDREGYTDAKAAFIRSVIGRRCA